LFKKHKNKRNHHFGLSFVNNFHTLNVDYYNLPPELADTTYKRHKLLQLSGQRSGAWKKIRNS